MVDQSFKVITKAENQSKSGNPEGSIETLEQHLEECSNDHAARMVIARILIYDLKRTEEGAAHLRVIIGMDPDHIDARKALVTILSAKKSNNKEVESLYEGLIARCSDAELYNSYARFLRMQKTDFKRSEEFYKKAIALSPKRYEFHQNYAVLLLNDLKDYETAKMELEEVLRLDPTNQPAKKNYDLLMRKKFDSEGNLIKKRKILSKR